MLYKIFSFGVIFVLIKSTYAQNTDLSNFTIADAQIMCNNYVSDTMVFNGEPNYCLNNSTKLYYTFSPYSNTTLGSTIIPKYRIFGSISSSYKLFGPFNQGDDIVNLIATNNAPVLINNTSSNIYPRVIGNVNVFQDKIYILEISVSSCNGNILFEFQGPDFRCSEQTSCENCIPKFQPVLGQYVVSAWVKEASNTTATTYTNGLLRVTSGSNVYNFYGTGQIIDGWQRIEGIVTTDNVGNLKIELLSNSGTVYFDDIRVFPKDGSMITYVYDPITLRLVAELDERNYAKIYEYDEEGKLIRVKKETEKGIMTIQENRENTHGQ